MNALKLSVLTATICGIVACSSVPQPIAGFESDPYGACIRKIAKDDSYADIKEKVSLDFTNRQTVAMLADTGKISANEKPLILSWASDRERCYSSNETTIKNSVSDASFEVIEESRNQEKLLIAKLYSGEISYGSFAQSRDSLAKAVRQSNAQIAASAEAEKKVAKAQQRELLLMQYNALQNKPAPTPMVPYQIPLRPTTTTNCTTTGGQINCIAR